MNFIKCDVSTICIGECASMAAVLLSSGTKGKRFRAAELHGAHPPALGRRPGPADGNRHRGRLHAEDAQAPEQIPSENTGQSIEKIQLDTKRDNYMTAEEAKEYGLVDEIIYHHGAMPERRRANKPSRTIVTRQLRPH